MGFWCVWKCVKLNYSCDWRGNRNIFARIKLQWLVSSTHLWMKLRKHLDSLLRVIIILYNVKHIVKCLLAVSNKKYLEISQVHSLMTLCFLSEHMWIRNSVPCFYHSQSVFCIRELRIFNRAEILNCWVAYQDDAMSQGSGGYRDSFWSRFLNKFS